MFVVNDLVLEGYSRAVINTDKSGIVTGWNAGAERIFQLGSMEVIGKNILSLNLNSSPDSTDIREFFRAESLETVRFASQWTTKQLETTNTTWFKHRWKTSDAMGTPVTYIVQDESKEKVIDSRLLSIREKIENIVIRKSENKCYSSYLSEDALENQDIGIWAINSIDGRHIYANRSAAELLNFGRSELLGLYFTDIDLNFSRKNLGEISEIVSLQGSITFKSLQLSKKGEFVKVSLTIYGLEASRDRPSHLLGFSSTNNNADQ